MEGTFAASFIAPDASSLIAEAVTDYEPLGPPPDGEGEGEEEEEISPLAYARANELSRDYLIDDSWMSEITRVQARITENTFDDHRLPKFDFGPELKVEERLPVPKEAAALLASIIKGETPQEIANFVAPLMLDHRRTKKLKVEFPLLRTNHETDYTDFARREGFEVTIQEVVLPLERVIEEYNEGLTWPASFWNLGTGVMEELKREKLSVSKDTLIYLMDTCKKDMWSKAENDSIWESFQTYKKNTAREPVSPPLSPRPTPFEPFEPSASDPAMQVPIFSDPVSPTKHELAEIERKIFEQDIPTPLRKVYNAEAPDDTSSDTYPGDGIVRLGDIYSPLASLEAMQSPPPIEAPRTKREHLKVEETLTPPGPDPALPKAVRFSDVVEEMDLDTGSLMNSPGFESRFFEEAFGSYYEKANQQSEQESLLEADATARVDVPVMDFSKANPPWQIFEGVLNGFKKITLQHSLMREVIGTELKIWPGSRKSDIKLKWIPFPDNLGKIALEEPPQGDDRVWKSIALPENEEIIESSTLAWKPEGLRILREDDDDDTIEYGQFRTDSPQDMSSLVKKRKMAMTETVLWTGGHPKPLAEFTGPKPQSLLPMKTTKSSNFVSASQKVEANEFNDGFGLLGGAFSAGKSLENYLELRGTKKPKLGESSYFQKKQAAQSVAQAQNSRLDSPQIHLPIRQSPIPKAKCAALPVPAVALPQPPTSIIVSSTLLKHRSLIKSLDKALPNLTLVERDFSAHNTLTWLPGSVTRSPITSPLAAEADLIVSPSTGIVLSTLQKIKQQPLPGSRAKSAIRERLEKVSDRYEKLVVFVSEGGSEEISEGLDESDCLAFAEFTAFALSKGRQTDISVQFVGGGEETLAKWIVSAIAQYRVPNHLELLAEETHWEIFLRRAGLNALAAQAVIGDIKVPEGVDANSPSKMGIFGLAAFVEMEREERLRRFAEICGRRVVERVSAVIDARWA